MFQLAGDSPEKAAAEAKSVMTIETAFAKASMPRVDMRDPKNIYHIMTVDQLKTLAPNFDWSAYFNNIGIRPFATLNVSTPEFFKGASQEIQEQDLAAWKSYLRWHAIHESAPYLSSNFVDENFHFFGDELAGQKQITPRWKRCTRLTDRDLGEAVGQNWVQKNFPPQDKASMQKLVTALDQGTGRRYRAVALDVRRDQERSRTETVTHPQQNRLSGPLEGLLIRQGFTGHTTGKH